MTVQPTTRTIFDASAYLDEELAIQDLMACDGISEDKVLERYDADQIGYHLSEMREGDYYDEFEQLAGFLEGWSDADRGANPNHGNRLVSRGTVWRWDGPSSGLAVHDRLANALDTSSIRLGLDNPLADCEIGRIADENGRLLVTGHHHDGMASIEIRQLTSEGERILAGLGEGGLITGAGVSAMGRTYRSGQEQGLLCDMWDDEAICARPRYFEREFGSVAVEFEVGRTRISARELSEGHPARERGLRLEAVVEVSGPHAGAGRFCRDILEAERWCEDHAEWVASRHSGDEYLPEAGLEAPVGVPDGPSSHEDLAER